jgi:hemolysin activation/secretion protein
LPHRVIGFVVATVCAGGFSAAVLAQAIPDAGSILRQQPRPPVASQPHPAPIGTPGETVTRVLIKAVRVEGATLIPVRELEAVLADLVGRESNLAEMQAATRRLVSYYARKGYTAQALLASQQIRDGVVVYQVIETGAPHAP